MDTLKVASSANTYSGMAKLVWEVSTPTAAENAWWRPFAQPMTGPPGSRRTMCGVLAMT